MSPPNIIGKIETTIRYGMGAYLSMLIVCFATSYHMNNTFMILNTIQSIPIIYAFWELYTIHDNITRFNSFKIHMTQNNAEENAKHLFDMILQHLQKFGLISIGGMLLDLIIYCTLMILGNDVQLTAILYVLHVIFHVLEIMQVFQIKRIGIEDKKMYI